MFLYINLKLAQITIYLNCPVFCTRGQNHLKKKGKGKGDEFYWEQRTKYFAGLILHLIKRYGFPFIDDKRDDRRGKWGMDFSYWLKKKTYFFLLFN